MKWKQEFTFVMPISFPKNKVVVFRFNKEELDVLETHISKFKDYGWDSSYTSSYAGTLVTFACTKLNNKMLTAGKTDKKSKYQTVKNKDLSAMSISSIDKINKVTAVIPYSNN